MFARVLTFTGVQDLDAAVDYLRGTALPIVQSQRGYKGMTASADRAAGVLAVLSMWETEADREASESALSKPRQEALGKFADDLKIDKLEERAVQMTKPPEVGARLMVTRFRMDPAKVDENIEFFKREVVPQVSASPGFRGLRNMIDPQTGQGLVGTMWDDEESMQSAAETATARRSEAVDRGVNFDETSFREIVFVDLR